MKNKLEQWKYYERRKYVTYFLDLGSYALSIIICQPTKRQRVISLLVLIIMQVNEMVAENSSHNIIFVNLVFHDFKLYKLFPPEARYYTYIYERVFFSSKMYNNYFYRV